MCSVFQAWLAVLIPHLVLGFSPNGSLFMTERWEVSLKLRRACVRASIVIAPRPIFIRKQGLAHFSDLAMFRWRSESAQNDNLDKNSTNAIVVYSGPTSLDRSLGKNDLYLKNFDYFLQNGIDCEHQDTVLVLTKEVATHYASTINAIRESCNDKIKNINKHNVVYIWHHQV